MCILFFYVNPNPSQDGFRLVLASNRDEYFKRPAKGICYYVVKETKLIIGGTDDEAGREGGMWLGITLNKSDVKPRVKVGVLLNVTGEERKEDALGRGVIVADYLKSEDPLDKFVSTLDMDRMNAFNFISIELGENATTVHHQSNSPVDRHQFEGENILGFSNSTVKSPYTKVKNGVAEFTRILSNHSKINSSKALIEELIQFLTMAKRHLPDEELQRRAPGWYEFLSSIFVSIPPAGYGTRTHSVILIDYDWNIDFVEKTMKQPIDPEHPQWETQHIRSRI